MNLGFEVFDQISLKKSLKNEKNKTAHSPYTIPHIELWEEIQYCHIIVVATLKGPLYRVCISWSAAGTHESRQKNTLSVLQKIPGQEETFARATGYIIHLFQAQPPTPYPLSRSSTQA